MRSSRRTRSASGHFSKSLRRRLANQWPITGTINHPVRCTKYKQDFCSCLFLNQTGSFSVQRYFSWSDHWNGLGRWCLLYWQWYWRVHRSHLTSKRKRTGSSVWSRPMMIQKIYEWSCPLRFGYPLPDQSASVPTIISLGFRNCFHEEHQLITSRIDWWNWTIFTKIWLGCGTTIHWDTNLLFTR